MRGSHKCWSTHLPLAQGIRLDDGQKAWYVKKAVTQLGDMKREFPPTPKEAFEASVEGTYYGNLIEAAEAQGRIGNFPAVEGVPVHTGWDIGHHDYTSIWFWQRLVGRLRIVGYFQDSGDGCSSLRRGRCPLLQEEETRNVARSGMRSWSVADPTATLAAKICYDAQSGSGDIEQLLVQAKTWPSPTTKTGTSDSIRGVRVLP